MSKEFISIQIIGCNHKTLSLQCSLYSSLVNKQITPRIINTENPALTFSDNELPDILLLLLDKDGISTLEYLSSLPSNQRPALIVITSSNDNQLMRLAMQAGARDFFTDPVNQDEIKHCLVSLFAEYLQTGRENKGVLTTIINAKGGSGASLIACNLAHIASTVSKSSNVLMDMDLQFGTQSLLLDLKPEHTVVEVLKDIKDIDFFAIEGYMAKHKSGLRLLSTLNEQIVLPGEIAVENLETLLELSLGNYDNVFVDLPRLIDPLSVSILDKSDHIIIVVQQTLAHMRDAKRLIKVLKGELSIAEKNIIVVVNRFDGDSSLTLKDIQTALECSDPFKIPNDYDKVATSTNLGIPLLDYAKKSPITLSLINLVEILGIEVSDHYKNKSFLKKLFGG